MKLFLAPSGVTVSYEIAGNGPPLVLVHGAFSNHRTNWEFVAPIFEKQFSVYAIARRGRGETSATVGHSLEDEGRDVVSIVQAIGEPVFLLGHSYGAHVALVAAANMADRVRRLVLYEPPWPQVVSPEALTPLERFAQIGDWDGFTVAFFRDVLLVPATELDEMRQTPGWPAAVADAAATLGDLRALSRYDFQAAHFSNLCVPVALQFGAESPRALYVTDALAGVLAHVQLQELTGQAHEGMTMAPQMYAEAVCRILNP